MAQGTSRHGYGIGLPQIDGRYDLTTFANVMFRVSGSFSRYDNIPTYTFASTGCILDVYSC